MNSFVRISLVAVAVTAAGVLAAGCKSDNKSGTATTESQKAVASIRDTRQELANAKADAQRANAALDRLAAGTSLPQTYNQYSQAVADVKEAGDQARARAQTLRARQNEFVARWERESQDVANPELRAGTAARREQIRANFETFKNNAQAARDSYQPYLRDLQDIQKVLANDLTPAGVEAAKPAIDKAKVEGEALIGHLDTLVAQLDNMGGSMASSPSKPASAK